MSNTKYFLHHVLLYINYETYTLVIPSEKTYPPPVNIVPRLAVESLFGFRLQPALCIIFIKELSFYINVFSS